MQTNHLLRIREGVSVWDGLLGFTDAGDIVEHPPINQEDPYAPAHTGVLEAVLSVNGVQRPMLTYVPYCFSTSGAGLFIFLEDGVSCRQGFEDGNWQAIAEEQDIAVILLEALPGGWNKNDIQKELDYATTAFFTSLSRSYYSLNESTYYAAGFGAGAYVAATFALLFTSVLAGFAADGDCALHPELLAQIGNLPSDGDKSVLRRSVPVPAWIIDRTGHAEALLGYLKAAADVCAEPLQNGAAQVYRTDSRHAQAWINGLPLCEVWHTSPAQAASLARPAENAEIVRFLKRTKRWMSGDDNNGSFRVARTYAEMGLERYEACVGGRRRHWYVYVPSAYKKNPRGIFPLVLAIHGYSCTGELYAENSEWHTVAEKRGFFVAYPTAYPGKMGGTRTPLPLWNCEQFTGEDGIDDVGFLLGVVEDVKSRYPIDDARVYAVGHSNGSAMTQLLLQKVSDVFAAYSAVGYTFGEKIGELPAREMRMATEGITCPVWLMKGEKDIGCGADLSPENANGKAVSFLCGLNGADEHGGRVYRNGAYIHHTYYGEDGVPYVRFTEVADLPHAYSPEMALMTWDEFFCRFVRLSGGKSGYLG